MPSLRPVVLKQASGYWIPLVVWAFCAYLLIDAVARGAWRVAGEYAPWLLLIAAVIYALLWRPSLIVHDDSAIIRNPFVSYRLPFADITDVRIGPTVSVRAQDAGGDVRRITSWNAPGAPRRSPRDRAGNERQRGGHLPNVRPGETNGQARDDAASDSQVLLERWRAYEAERAPQPVARRMDVLPVGAVAVCAVWSALTLLA